MYGLISDVLAEKGSQVYVISRRETVQDAVREMNDKGVGALVVLDHDHPIGIFTERDILRRVVDQGRDPAATHVSAVMSSELTTIAPDASVAAAMELMTSGRVRHLPVVDANGMTGIVSIGDLLRWLMIHQEAIINQLGYPGLRQLG